MLSNLFAPMPIEDSKEAAGRILPYFVQVAVGVLHLRPVLTVFVLGVSVLLNTDGVLYVPPHVLCE